MNPRLASPPSPDSTPAPAGFPDADELAALRAWYAGMTVRQAVERYLPDRLGEGRSARGVIGGIRRRLVRVARQAGRPDLAEQLGHPDGERMREAKAAAEAVGLLRHARAPVP
ncbi:integrase, partial [Burkholderia sp. Ac-20384]|nr:integrase [Burkholderia sp. Ac-20384]